MESITRNLTHIHRECDALFVGAENAVTGNNWNDTGRLFPQFRACMEQHLRAEEDVLFPAIERRSDYAGGPTGTMRMEHAQMRELLHAMDRSLAERNRQQYLGQSETLLILMQQHNIKEENVLYPMADRILAGDASDILRSMREPDCLDPVSRAGLR